MTRNVKKFSQEEFSKLVDEFVKKSVSVILQSRIPSKELQKHNTKNTYFFTNDNFYLDFGNLFNDEYKDLKPLSDTQDISLIIDIYYNYDKVKLLCEKFSLNINFKKPKEEEYIRRRLIKKLSSFVRSLHSVTRVLPGFYFFQNKKFDFSLDYKIYYNTTQKDEKFLKIPQEIKFNLDSDLGLIRFEVKYYLKNEIFILAKELESRKLEEKTSNLIRRSRVLSENLCPRFSELLEEKKEETKKTFKTKSNQYIDTNFENNIQSNTLIETSPKRNYKHGDFFSITSCSYSDDYKLEKNKSPNSIDFIKKEMKMFTTYLTPTELNLEKTSSSETSSLDSYELEFESNNEENSLNTNEIKKGEEIFILDEMVSKLKNFKKMIKNSSYRPLIINYKSFMNVN